MVKAHVEGRHTAAFTSEYTIAHNKSEKQRLAVSQAFKGRESPWLLADKNTSWKGDKVGYHGLHKWVARWLGKPTMCEHCKKDGLTGQKIHWANKSGEYLRELSDWIRLCASCHGAYDKKTI